MNRDSADGKHRENDFPGVGKYGIPEIKPETDIRIDKLEWIPVNYALTAKDKATKGVHFTRTITSLNGSGTTRTSISRFCSSSARYVRRIFALQRYAACGAAFHALQKHWLAAYWQAHGSHVIPTLCWCGERSYDWCFDGEPRNAIVSISSHGTQSDPYEAECFAKHCRKALEVLQPSSILWYGKCPTEFDWNVTKIKPFQYERRHYRE